VGETLIRTDSASVAWDGGNQGVALDQLGDARSRDRSGGVVRQRTDASGVCAGALNRGFLQLAPPMGRNWIRRIDGGCGDSSGDGGVSVQPEDSGVAAVVSPSGLALDRLGRVPLIADSVATIDGPMLATRELPGSGTSGTPLHPTIRAQPSFVCPIRVITRQLLPACSRCSQLREAGSLAAPTSE